MSSLGSISCRFDIREATATFPTHAQAVKHVARHAGDALRFHDLRHSYATWLVDDEVPPNMVQRVMGHEHVAPTLQLYVRRSEHRDRIRKALNGTTGANFTSSDASFAALDTNE